jgi:hypothetical protein
MIGKVAYGPVRTIGTDSQRHGPSVEGLKARDERPLQKTNWDFYMERHFVVNSTFWI